MNDNCLFSSKLFYVDKSPSIARNRRDKFYEYKMLVYLELYPVLLQTFGLQEYSEIPFKSISQNLKLKKLM